jgi:tetratricopeptide (TPR) repeat protein
MVFDDAWDHAPWLDRLLQLAQQAPDHPKVHLYIGAAYVEMGQYRQAIVSLTRALTCDAGLADAYRRRGDCHYILVPVLGGEVQVYYDRALADYEAVLQIEPDVYTYNVHASIIGALGQWDNSIEEYDRAIELAPDYAETFFNRGYAYKVLGHKEPAIADFERFLSFEEHWNQDLVSQAQAHIKELSEPDL